MSARGDRKRHRLGAHMSVAGGFPRAVDRAEALGAGALQVFVKSARRWDGRTVESDEAAEFRRRVGAAGLERHTLAHAGYLINLASPDRTLRERSIVGLADEMDRCGKLGIGQLVLHPGSHLGQGEDRGVERVARALDRAVRRAGRAGRQGAEVELLLEVTAGQGTSLGHRFEHLAWILERAEERERLGVCFDTCHAFAAGHDLRDRRSYRETFSRFDRVIGLERLRAFHLNDSRGRLGSRKDRHEHIGCGELGTAAFELLLADRRFVDLPMVLETPKGEDLSGDRRNLDLLRRLGAGEGRR